MFSELLTFILYNLILFICPVLCYKGQKTNKKNYIYWAYAIIFLISIFRFDIGADYRDYALGIIKRCNDINSGYPLMEIFKSYSVEPTMIIFNYIFSWSEYPYVWIIGMYSLLSHFFLYKALDYYKIHTWGLFIYILSFMLFQGWDWVRQSVAMSIFLYSLRYIEANNLKRFIVYGVIAFLFHYSAIIVLTIYFSRFIRIKGKILFLVLFLVFVFAEFGLFNFINRFLSSVMVYYNDDYSSSNHVLQVSSTYRSTTYILTMVWYIFLLFIARNLENKTVLCSFFLGAILYGIGGGNLLFLRMAYYLTASQLILFPFALMNYKNRIMLILMIMLQIIIFNRVYIGSNFRGCTPYETIFSEQFKKQIFRIKNY